MEKHPVPHFTLVERAIQLEKSIRENVSNAISISDLFEAKKVLRHASKKHKTDGLERVPLDSVFKKSDFTETIKKCVVPYNGDSTWKHNEPFQGMYVFSKGKIPVYLGISRNVFSRLKQHFYGKTHFAASLAYRLAALKTEENKDKKLRSEIDFSIEQACMRKNFRIQVIPISCDYELYWLEVTLAGLLGTRHNEFRTH